MQCERKYYSNKNVEACDDDMAWMMPYGLGLRHQEYFKLNVFVVMKSIRIH